MVSVNNIVTFILLLSPISEELPSRILVLPGVVVIPSVVVNVVVPVNIKNDHGKTRISIPENLYPKVQHLFDVLNI